jgi:hypothetical protein
VQLAGTPLTRRDALAFEIVCIEIDSAAELVRSLATYPNDPASAGSIAASHSAWST